MSLDYPNKLVQLFKTSEINKFHIKITFAMTINKVQGQTFNRVAIYLPSTVFPMASCMWRFPDPVRFTPLLLQLLNGMDSLKMTSNTVCTEVLRSLNIYTYILNKYLMFSTRELLARLQVFILITLLATITLFMSVHP